MPIRNRIHPARSALRGLALLAAVPLALTAMAGPASAHGSIVDPPSRAYDCWDRWGDDHLNPDMADEDPMCAQAWEANPNAMWNWNGIYQNGLGGNYQSIPDGQICSAGGTYNNQFVALDEPGDWETTDIASGSTVTMHLYDQAYHGADYFSVYVTQQGFDPATQPLSWGSLDHVTTTGSFPENDNILFDVTFPGRSGHHVIVTVWKASHMDQTYFLCSDVNFT
jgi:lytic cellulose monooxygenase (C4-dehydrogenating)